MISTFTWSFLNTLALAHRKNFKCKGRWMRTRAGISAFGYPPRSSPEAHCPTTGRVVRAVGRIPPPSFFFLYAKLNTTVTLACPLRVWVSAVIVIVLHDEEFHVFTQPPAA